jgi:hypothetical protein
MGVFTSRKIRRAGMKHSGSCEVWVEGAKRRGCIVQTRDEKIHILKGKNNNFMPLN